MTPSPAARFEGWSAAGLALATLLVSRAASSHPADFSAFYAETEGPRVRVTFDVHPRALAEAVPALDTDLDGELTASEIAFGAAVIDAYLDARLQLSADGAPCKPAFARTARLAATTRVKLDFEEQCDHAPRALTWQVRALTEIQGGHSVVGRTRLGGTYDHWLFKSGAETRTVIGAPEPAAPPLPPAAPPPPRAPTTPTVLSSVGTFVDLGLRHILGGPDHLLFVVGLVVAARRFRDLALVVTSFTLAHSATLALGVLGVATAPSRLVEPLIALSICWVGVDNLRQAPPRHRPWVTFGFGLLHGLGFSGALREIALPTGARVSALFGFNLGVELGQLAVVIPMFLLLGWGVRGRRWERPCVRGVNGLVAALGGLWLVDRAFALGWMP